MVCVWNSKHRDSPSHHVGISSSCRIAYAYINSYLSVYNDQWCNSPSGQLHELGHNLNLAHSGEGTNAYGDQSGMMGYSYSTDEGPIMCFNPAKSWQLGWYDGRYATVDPLSQTWSGKLIGVTDYQSAAPGKLSASID